MNRRTFLLGTSSVAAGGSTLLGTGAFSRVESHRQVTVKVAEDTEAYLGLKPIDTPNSNNFVELDENGHLKVDIGDYDAANPDTEYDRPTGVGINSDSNTLFEGMFDICNQGKASAEVRIDVDLDDLIDDGDPMIDFRDKNNKSLVLTNGKTIDTGECERVSIDLASFSVDANSDEPLFDGDVVVHAEAEGAGATEE